MVKYLFIIISLFPASSFATEQTPDTILYLDEKSELATSWEYPSPLEVYFRISKIKYPFHPLSTGNYRGHVASWELDNDGFYLKEVQVKDKTIDLKTIFPESTRRIKADWFSGILLVKTGKYRKNYPGGTYSAMYKNYVFLKIKKGKLINKTTLTSDQYLTLVSEFFKRRKTTNPVTEGPIYEFNKYILSTNQ